MSEPEPGVLQRSAATAFAHAFVSAVQNRILHPRESRFVEDALAELSRTLQQAAATGVPMPLLLQLTDDRLHFDGQPLDGPSLQAKTLLRLCSERRVTALAFAPGLDAAEANRCLDLLLLPEHAPAFSSHRLDDALQASGIRHLRFTQRSPHEPSEHPTSTDGLQQALHRYQDLAESLQQNHMRAHRDLELAIDAAAGAVERTVAQFDEPSLLLSLAAQDDVDRFTIGHSVRVALLALQVARELGGSREQLVRVGAAALLHDIGKSKVPQGILFKQDKLTTDEWQWMAQHPRLGAQILLEQHEQVDPRAIGAAFCHHMGPTGAGYPKPTMPIVPSGISRLVRVCDVFEALTSVRPYKRAITPVEAYAVMFRNEKDFDPAWLRLFVRTLGMFPTGSRVSLADGSEAIVTAQTGCPERPVVQVLLGPDGADLAPGQSGRLQVGESFEGALVQIRSVITPTCSIPVPEFDRADPEVLTQTCQHACLSTAMQTGCAPPAP